jgi:desulfoferrodoxin (superoxide reductase-like protein)
MKKTLSAVVFLCGFFLLPTISHATAPSIVEPTYEAATHTLSVRIRHWSFSDSLHYIKTVEVKVNGTVFSTNKYTSQPDTEYTYTYDVTAAPGDTIEVTASCNLWGSKTVALTLPKGTAAAGGEPTPKPSDAPKTDSPAKP